MNRFENNGFIQSQLSEKDIIFEYSKKQSLPTEYTYDVVIDNIKNQGNTYKCVAYTLSYILELQSRLNDNPIKMDINNLYSKRENPEEDGMSIKNALNIIRHDGYKHNKGISYISQYARLGSIPAMKASLIANGPFILALPACDTTDDTFWKGGERLGGHAISCVGYNEEGFILMNSWGSSFGIDGKVILPYDDIKYIMEAWTMIL